MIRKLYSNIYKLYLIKLSKWLMLIMPIVALFYSENGLSDFDIFLLQAIYSVSVSVMEIPSGYMADIIGRKKSLIAGSILGTLGFVIYSFSHSFSGFLVAEIILGLGGSFISGSDSALLFDSLAAIKLKHKYLQFEGRITSLGNFAETIAAICGGMIAAYLSFRSVYIAQTFIAAMAIPATLLLVEPDRENVTEKPGLQHILQVCRNAIFIDKKLSSAIVLSSVIGIATLSMAWCAQVYFINQDFSEREITPLWVSLNLIAAIFAAYASGVRKFLGNRNSLLVIIIYIPLGYILLGQLSLLAALASLALFYAVRGYATPVLKDLINQNCESATRATVLSIRNMIIRFGFALLGPAIGLISGQYSIGLALGIAGGILLIFSVLSGYRLYRNLPDSYS